MRGAHVNSEIWVAVRLAGLLRVECDPLSEGCPQQCYKPHGPSVAHSYHSASDGIVFLWSTLWDLLL